MDIYNCLTQNICLNKPKQKKNHDKLEGANVVCFIMYHSLHVPINYLAIL